MTAGSEHLSGIKIFSLLSWYCTIVPPTYFDSTYWKRSLLTIQNIKSFKHTASCTPHIHSCIFVTELHDKASSLCWYRYAFSVT